MATFLIPDKVEVTRLVGGRRLKINQKIIPNSYKAPRYVAPYVPKGAPIKPCALLHGDGIPQGITVHNTNMITPAAGTDAAEQYCRATYAGNMGGVVVHYYIWHDVIWQLLDDRERGWHAADGSSRKIAHDGKSMIGGNIDTIAIEAIGADDETEEITATLCAYLCQAYNLLPTQDVYTHKYFSGKECPVYILPHWDAFLKRVKTLYLGAGSTEQQETGTAADEPADWASESWAWAKRMGLVTSSKPTDAVTFQHLTVVLDRLEHQ